MKVLLLTDGIYPYSMGGMQKHSYNLARYLVKEGVEVDVAHCVYGEDGLPKNEDVAKVLGLKPENVFGYQFPKSIPFPGHYIYCSKVYSKTLFNQFKNKLNDYDAIYSQGFTAWEFLKKTTKNSRPPVLLNLHGVEMYQPAYSTKEKLEKLLMRIPAKFLFEKADYIQSLGGKLTSLIKQITHNSNVWECGIGIESSWFVNQEDVKFESSKVRFAFIGRNEQRKGVHILNPVLESLIELNYNFTVDFIGEMPQESRLEINNFVYHGKIVDEQKIKQTLNQCDVLLIPSLSEGMPTVILEAMSRGMAILATDVGAVQNMVDDSNGWLIKPGSQTELFSTIKHILESDKNKIYQKKLHSLQKVKEHEWSIVAKKQIEFFKFL